MNRKEFLKAGCGAGLCACAGLSLLSQLACAETAAPKEDKPVKVELVESVLRGGKRCVFKIRILS